MRRSVSFFLSIVVFFISTSLTQAQTTTKYKISFPDAVHHLAKVEVEFSNTDLRPLEVRMSRTSPGRYALHEFSKNVFDVKAVDSQGKALDISRPDPYSWLISGHDGTVVLSYTLFGDRGDGTYSQIDDTHAHLNVPATFMYAPDLAHRPIQLEVDLTGHAEWKVATQLKSLSPTTFYAPELHYFMDSPLEVSDFRVREWEVKSTTGHTQKIRFVLHDTASEALLEAYVEKVKNVVEEARDVFGELPEFDFGQYTFLACYMPQATGDGMEHRNSTVISSTRSLAQGGLENNIGTVSHEFFHCWNVERIRPRNLQPFDYTKANMSGELWFAEGFTSYYTTLLLKRAGIYTEQQYLGDLERTLNYVINSPGRNHFNIVEMSYQAPFVDAATSVDPVNRENTFISYYTYGSFLGLALDLTLRGLDLTLDGYMQLMWKQFGKAEVAYTIKDLEGGLAQYAGDDFSKAFFNSYVYKSTIPNWEELFEKVGLVYNSTKKDRVFTGVYISKVSEKPTIRNYPLENSPAWKAGWDKGDEIIKINGKDIEVEVSKNIFDNNKPGDKVSVTLLRNGQLVETVIQLGNDPTIAVEAKQKPEKQSKKRKELWLGTQQ